jgi:hypothetical protein
VIEKDTYVRIAKREGLKTNSRGETLLKKKKEGV